MSKIARPPFTLPDNPAHLHEVQWFRVDFAGRDVPYIIGRRAIYHVHSKWAEMFPGERHGADFNDQWQLFERYRSGDSWRFNGRSAEGWFTLVNGPYWTDCFATEQEAAKRALEIVRERIASREEQIAELKQAAIRFARFAFPDGES